MENILKDEVKGFINTTNTRLTSLEQAIYGYNPNTPLSLSDLGSDITSYYSPSQFYKKGEPIASRDLPTVPTKAYVDSRTRGLLTSVLGYQAIDEIVNARESQTNLVTNLGRYSLKTGLITNINALSSGTIDKERLEPQDHNTLTNRNTADAHPTSAITSLDTTIGLKTDKSTILATINSSTEVTKIDPDQIQPIPHSDLSGTSDADSHPISAITGLTAALASGESALDAINAVLTATGYSSLADLFECVRDYLEAIDGVGLPSKPVCWI